MVNEQKLKESFAKVKEDVEGIKNELAFAIKRIARIEEKLSEIAIESFAKSKKKK